MTPYYEIHGDGKPLLLVHGGFGTSRSWGPVLDGLAARRQVVTVELQGHGHTADVERPLRYESMADDLAGLIDLLGTGPVDVLGLSLGGGVALRLGLQHPGKVRDLVLVSTPCARNGWFPGVLAGMAELGPATAEPMKQSPMYQEYAAVAPRPDDWATLVTKVGELLRREYDWSDEVRGLQPRTLLVYGDADSIPLTHAATFYGLLGGSLQDAGWDGQGRPKAQVAVLPDETHYTIGTSPRLAEVANRFLDGGSRTP